MTDSAETSLRDLLLDSPSFDQPEIEQVRAAIENHQVAVVAQVYGELQRRSDQGSPSQRDSLAAGATACLLARHEEAQQFLAQVKNNAAAHFLRATSLMALGRYNEAGAEYESAEKSGYDATECRLRRVGAIRLSGDLEGAQAVLRENARSGATRAEYSYQMGGILADQGDAYGAIEYFERAVDMDPHHSGALFRLAGENYLLGNDDEAVRLYERALSKPPYSAGGLINLGLLYEDRENYAAAAFCFRRVLEAFPNNEQARLYLKDIEASGEMYYDEDADRRQRELEQTMRIPLSDFELSARSRNCLENAGIHTLGELTQVTEQDLLNEKNFGETSLKEIQEILEQRGLRIGQAVEQPRQPAPVVQLEELSPQERALLEKPVTELGLSVRSRKCLSRLGITMLSDLVSRTPDELLSVRNFGVTSLNEIRAKLAEVDLKLRND